MPPPSMALWPMSDFELKAFVIQQDAKESLPRASLISKTRNFREVRTAIFSLLGKFYGQEDWKCVPT